MFPFEQIAAVNQRDAGTVTTDSIWDMAVRFVATIVFSMELEKLILSLGGALPESQAAPLWRALERARGYLGQAQPTIEGRLPIDWYELGEGLCIGRE